MLDVASLEKFDFWDHFTLISGASGVYRNISNVVILDYEGIEGDFSGFHEGDFVITNLLFAKNDPEKIYPAFLSLIEKGVSAFAIKTVFYSDLPDEVMALTEQRQVPVFLFHDIYIEDVILNITDHLRSLGNYSYYEELIDTFVCPPAHHDAIHRLLATLFPSGEGMLLYPFLSSAYLLHPSGIDEFSLQRTLNRLQLQLRHMKTSAHLQVIKYRKGILLLCFFPEEKAPEEIAALWKSILAELMLTDYLAGISDLTLPLSKIDLSVERSIHACESSKHHCLPLIRYSDLGLSNLLYSLSKDAYSAEYLAELSTRLSGEKYAPLRATMQTLVEQHFDIDEAARALYQHPNTIRYRISRLKEHLGVKNELEFQILAILLTVSQSDHSENATDAHTEESTGRGTAHTRH